MITTKCNFCKKEIEQKTTGRVRKFCSSNCRLKSFREQKKAEATPSQVEANTKTHIEAQPTQMQKAVIDEKKSETLHFLT